MKLQALLSMIGAVSGLMGTVMGYVSIRRTRELKATDLRIDLRKAANSLSALSAELPALLNSAKLSREAAPMSPMGAWTDGMTADLETAKQIESDLPPKLLSLERVSHAELENRIVAVHRLSLAAQAVKEKYEASMQRDEKQRIEFQGVMDRILR